VKESLLQYMVQRKQYQCEEPANYQVYVWLLTNCLVMMAHPEW